MQTDTAIDLVRSSASTVLEHVYVGNSVRSWVAALGVFAATFLVLLLARWLFMRRLGNLARRTRTQIDDYVVAVLKNTKYSFLVVVALAAALKVLVLPDRVAELVTPLARLAVIIQVGLWAGHLVSLYLERITASRATADAASITTIRAIGMVVRLVLWVIVLLMALANFHVDVGGLITGLGIAGVAVALAVQNVLGDLLASLSIVLDKPFVVGDFIIVDSYKGTVDDIGLKSTRLRSLSGEQLIFSNTDLLKSRIQNYKRMIERRVVFAFGVEYGTPQPVLEQLPQVVKEIITGIEQTRFDRSHFLKFGDSSLDFETVYYVLSPDYALYMDVQQRINLALYERVQALGASFAFPTRTIWMREEAVTSTSNMPGEERDEAAVLRRGS